MLCKTTLFWLGSWYAICAVREVDDDVIDEWTNAGYRQTVAVWDARDEVDFVLGKGAWRTLLPEMQIGRLRPTPWLNKVSAYLN